MGWNQIMNSKFNTEIVEGEEKQDDRGLIEASLVTEKKTKTNDTSTPLAERGWQCVSECKWMKINRRVGGDGEQKVNRHRRRCQPECEGSGRQRGEEMKRAKETHTKQRTHKVCRSGYTEWRRGGRQCTQEILSLEAKQGRAEAKETTIRPC